MKIDEAPCVRIVDDEPAIRRLLGQIIAQCGLRFRCFESAEQFMSDDDLTEPGCVLIDLNLNGLRGEDLVLWISKQSNPLPTLVITGKGSALLAVKCIKGGASDYLEKPVKPLELLIRVRQAVEQDARQRVLTQHVEILRERFETLSAREKSVLQQVAHGLSSKQIAFQLGISTRTIELHRAHVMQKMHLESVADAVKVIIELGL